MNRLSEFSKTVLIVLLTVSAVFLTGRTWLTAVGSNGDWRTLFNKDTVNLPVAYNEYEEINSVITLLTPLRASVRSESGFCTLPNASAVSGLFERTRVSMNEALSTASDVQTVDVTEWRKALDRDMVFYDFEGYIPLDALALLGTGTSVEFPSVRYLVLSAEDDESVSIYCKDKDGSYLRYTTEAQASHLRSVLTGYEADGSEFVYKKIPSADTMLTTASYTDGTLAREGVITDISSADTNRMISVILENLGFNSYTTKAYPETDTSRVYVEDLDTLRVSLDGTLQFYAPSADNGTYTAPTGLDKANILADAATILRNAVGLYLGDASAYLIDCYTDQATGRFVLLFGIHSDGVPVKTEKGYAASLEYCGNVVTVGDMRIATYRKTDGTAPLLPAVQAYAAMKDGGELGLRYVYGETAYSKNWYRIAD